MAMTGQRLQTMRKDQNPDAQVDLVASLNAADAERNGSVAESDEE
jgi:hypothetical protein